MTNKTVFVQTIAIVLSLLTLTFAIYQHTDTQNQILNQDFVTQLENYDSKISNIDTQFKLSNQKFNDCKIASTQLLDLLDRLAYLKIQDRLSQEFIQFFHSDFKSGTTALAWLEFTEPTRGTWSNAFTNFREVESTLEYSGGPAVPFESCFYYVDKMNTNSNYDPRLDDKDSSSYNYSQDDLKSIFK